MKNSESKSLLKKIAVAKFEILDKRKQVLEDFNKSKSILMSFKVSFTICKLNNGQVYLKKEMHIENIDNYYHMYKEISGKPKYTRKTLCSCTENIIIMVRRLA